MLIRCITSSDGEWTMANMIFDFESPVVPSIGHGLIGPSPEFTTYLIAKIIWTPTDSGGRLVNLMLEKFNAQG